MAGTASEDGGTADIEPQDLPSRPSRTDPNTPGTRELVHIRANSL